METLTFAVTLLIGALMGGGATCAFLAIIIGRALRR